MQCYKNMKITGHLIYYYRLHRSRIIQRDCTGNTHLYRHNITHNRLFREVNNLIPQACRRLGFRLSRRK